jgi:hypothetical protein
MYHPACQRREDLDESLLRGLLQRRLLRLLLAAMGAEEPGPPTLTEPSKTRYAARRSA